MPEDKVDVECTDDVEQDETIKQVEHFTMNCLSVLEQLVVKNIGQYPNLESKDMEILVVVTHKDVITFDSTISNVVEKLKRVIKTILASGKLKEGRNENKGVIH